MAFVECFLFLNKAVSHNATKDTNKAGSLKQKSVSLGK